MGFLSSFFGHAAANAINEANKETKKHNELCYQLSDYNKYLDDYLKKVGCDAVYVADWGCIDSGSIAIEKRKMDTIRKKVEQYIQLGGNPQYIHDLDELDDYIEKIKYLKSKDSLDRQKEFEHQELYWVKDEIEREEKDNREISILLNAQGNELSSVVNQRDNLYVPYNDINDSDDTIRIDTAKSYNEFTVQFLEYKTVSLKFNETGYCIYSYEDHAQMFYKTTINKNQNVEVSSIPIPAVQGWSMLVINGMELLCSSEEAEKVTELYTKHNISIFLEGNAMCEVATENINELSGIEFEKVCQQLVENMGFETETTKASGDGGIDLVAYNHQPLLSGKYIIQCKRYTGSVGEPIIRDLFGVVMSERANKGILMTTGHFTKSAIAFAEGKPIELIDGNKMNALLMENGVVINVTGGNSNYKHLDEEIQEILLSLQHGCDDKTLLDEKIDECISICKKFIETDNGTLPYSFYQDQVRLHIADLSLIKGDLDIAFRNYTELLNSVPLKEFYEYRVNLKSEITPVVFNIIQICNILGLEEISAKYQEEYSDYLQSALEISKSALESSLDESEMADLDEDEIDDYVEFMKQEYGCEIDGYENLDKISFIVVNISATGIYNPGFKKGMYASPFAMTGWGNKRIELENDNPIGIEGYAEWGVTRQDLDRMKKNIR